MLTVFVGIDGREMAAVSVAVNSLRRFVGDEVVIRTIDRPMLELMGLYRRPTRRDELQLWDEISGAPMATEFSIARFFIGQFGFRGHALFVDADVMFRADPRELLALMPPEAALGCVQHDHRPEETVKMMGQAQTSYPRKNWSSVMLWNLDHTAHARLTLDRLNNLTGRELHRFQWLEDSEIVALPSAWNHLVGVDAPRPDARLAHFTLGTPDMPPRAHDEYADEWRGVLTAPQRAAS